jgi:hypothetical protein
VAAGEFLTEAIGRNESCLWESKVEWRENRTSLEARTSSGAISRQELDRGDRAQATEQLLEALDPARLAFLGNL